MAVLSDNTDDFVVDQQQQQQTTTTNHHKKKKHTKHNNNNNHKTREEPLKKKDNDLTKQKNNNKKSPTKRPSAWHSDYAQHLMDSARHHYWFLQRLHALNVTLQPSTPVQLDRYLHLWLPLVAEAATNVHNNNNDPQQTVKRDETRPRIPHVVFPNDTEQDVPKKNKNNQQGKLQMKDQTPNATVPRATTTSTTVSTRNKLIPPPDIAWLWHCHRLAPLRYQAYCLERFGRVLECTRPFEFCTEEDPVFDTQELWQEHYPTQPFFLIPSSSQAQQEEPQEYECCSNSNADQDGTTMNEQNDNHGNMNTTTVVHPIAHTLTGQSLEIGHGYHAMAAARRQATMLWTLSQPLFLQSLDKDNHHWFLEQAVNRYFQFLALPQGTAGLPLVPTIAIDWIWHTHMLLSNQEYRDDCMAIRGEWFFHDDAMGDDRNATAPKEEAETEPRKAREDESIPKEEEERNETKDDRNTTTQSSSSSSISSLDQAFDETCRLWNQAYGTNYIVPGAMYPGPPPPDYLDSEWKPPPPCPCRQCHRQEQRQERQYRRERRHLQSRVRFCRPSLVPWWGRKHNGI